MIQRIYDRMALEKWLGKQGSRKNVASKNDNGKFAHVNLQLWQNSRKHNVS